MAQQSPLYVIASPRPRVGKTLIARLLIEFFRHGGRPLVGYDLNPRDPALAGQFPRFVFSIDIAETLGQMELFDKLLAEPSITSVIDLGYGPFEQFFAVMEEIGFAEEARLRLTEPIVLFVTDPAPATVRSYADLRHRFPGTIFVPVHNEAVSLMFEKLDFPPTHAGCPMIRIPRLSPIVRSVIDRPSFSFGSHIVDRSTGPTEIDDWVNAIFTEFRELELRLLLGRLGSALGGVLSRDPRSSRKPRE